jgi:peptide/nickel transport system substrate-binding protein
VDGLLAPLPAPHFSTMDPGAILKSPENLNPQVVSGPFLMSESVPGDHYTLVRNPRYYRASQGLPYLDKVVFIVPSFDASLKDLRTGSIDATGLFFDVNDFQDFQRLKNYTIISPPVQNGFEALYFNFHNTVLASHLEVRQAMAMAVDQQALIAGPLNGLGSLLCTDHPAAYHPGYDPLAPCPLFDLAAANKLLDDNGWVKGPDGVRAKGRQRLEFEYSTAPGNLPTSTSRPGVETIIQRDFMQIGIKLDIQNYPATTFFGPFLTEGKASPPMGAVAGRYDIAEYANNLSYDPDDSTLFACNQVPPTGSNYVFYCNPSLDALYVQEQATADPGLRQQIFKQIHQIYLTQFPFIVQFGWVEYALEHKGTHNYLPGPYIDTYNIAEWWCDNGKC